MLKTMTATIAGALLGIIGARNLLVGSALSLILWGLTGFLIGAWCDTRRQSLLNGGLYGFVLSFVFMLSGYAGSEPVLSRFPFFALLGVFGAVCGLVLGWIGFFFKSKWAQRRNNTRSQHDFDRGNAGEGRGIRYKIPIDRLTGYACVADQLKNLCKCLAPTNRAIAS